MARSLVVLSFAVVSFGCGVGASSEDVAAYRSTVSELQAVVATHESDGASATAEACAKEHQRYDDQVRPRVEQLSGSSPGLDRCRPMGLGSMCGSMRTELDRHAKAACSPDAAANHAEVVAHCRRMNDWLAKQASGSASLMGGMMGGAPRCGP